MKKSALISLLIFSLCAVPCVLQQRSLSNAQASYATLEVAAAKLGIRPTTDGTRLTQSQREDLAKQAQAQVAEARAMAVKLEETAKNQGRNSDEYLKQSDLLMAKLEGMAESPLRTFLNELRRNSQIPERSLREITSLVIMQRTAPAPQSALGLIHEFSDLLPKSDLRSDLISESLGSLAATQPAAALEWIAQNSAKFPELADDKVSAEVIRGAAKSDARGAFKLIAKLKLKDSGEAVKAIIETGNANADSRNSVLAALREHLGTLADAADREKIRGSAFESLAENLDSQGIEAMVGWISKSKFTPEETTQFASGLSYFSTRQDTGRWVEWLGKNLPSEGLAKPVGELIGDWTQQDYKGAGTWLAAAAESPAKQAAVHAYAKAVAEYEPKVAEQWAMTLPAGQLKDETLRVIYRNWPSNDPQGASAFATAHGMN
jgi:hypothetical protein